MTDTRRLKVVIEGDSDGVKRAFRNVETDAKRTDTKLQKLSKSTGDAMVKMAASLPGVMGSAVSAGGPVVSAAVLGLIATIGIVAAPALAAIISGGIMLALSGAVIGAGIIAAAKSPEVQKAWGKFTERAKTALSGFAEPFKGPVMEALKIFGDTVEDIAPSLKDVGKTLAPLITPMATAISELAKNALPGIKEMLEKSKPVIEKVAEKLPAIGSAISDFFKSIGDNPEDTTTAIGDLMDALAWLIRDAGKSLAWFVGMYIDTRIKVIAVIDAIKWAWQKLMEFFHWFVGGWKKMFDDIKSKVETVMGKVRDAFKWTKDFVGTEWAKLQDLAKKPVSFIVNTVYNNGIRKLWNMVADKFGGSQLGEIKGFAAGGVLPGYAPRKDRIPAMLSPGEGILVPEAVKALGASRILQWNKDARNGKPVEFADGGIIGWGKKLLSKSPGIFAGVAGSAIKSLVADLRNIIGGTPGSAPWTSQARRVPNKALDGIQDWVKRKDSDIMKGIGGAALGKLGSGIGHMGWVAQMAILRARFPGLPLISGYRPGAHTLTGNLSYHALGRAVDVPPRRDVFEWIRAVFGGKTKELIFSPMGGRQLWNGKPHFYGEPIRGQHWNHVHWAMDQGGQLPPNSTTVVKNATSSPEYALPEGKLKRMLGNGVTQIFEEGSIVIKSDKVDARALRDELTRLANRNGGKVKFAR